MIRPAALAAAMAVALVSGPVFAEGPGVAPGSSGGVAGRTLDCPDGSCAASSARPAPGSPGVSSHRPSAGDYRPPRGSEPGLRPGYDRPIRPPHYRPPYYQPPRYRPPYVGEPPYHLERRISCEQARAIVRREGFRSVRTRNCEGYRYEFRAVRHGRAYLVTVHALSGDILSVRRI